MDQELKAFLEEMKASMDERFVRLEARMDERFERVETEGRHTRVLLEGMHDNIRLLAEGVMGVTERLEAFQRETADHFTEVKATLSPVYQNLNGRVTVSTAKSSTWRAVYKPWTAG